MSEIGQGLFNRDMMRSIKDRWHNGGIGILYVRIDAGSVEAEWMLHDWSNDEPGIFWRQRLDMDFVFLLERQQRVETVVRLAEAAAARLQKYVSGKMEKLQIGLAAAFPSLTGRSSETVFYRALLEAMEQQTAAVAGTSHHAASPDEWLCRTKLCGSDRSRLLIRCFRQERGCPRSLIYSIRTRKPMVR
jgi:hypothetical protein